MSQKIGMGTIATRKTRPHLILAASRHASSEKREASILWHVQYLSSAAPHSTDVWGIIRETRAQSGQSQAVANQTKTSSQTPKKSASPLALYASQRFYLKPSPHAPLLALLDPP